MNAPAFDFATWLCDYYLWTTVLLTVVLVVSVLIRQPVRRRALAWSTVLGLFALALFCAWPDWAQVHLISKPIQLGEPRSVVQHVEEHAVTPPVPLAPLKDSVVESPASKPTATAPVTTLVDYGALALWVFASGSLVVLSWLLIGACQVHRLCRAAMAPPQVVASLYSELTGQIFNPPRLGIVQLPVPVAVGLFRPMILVPEALAQAAATDDLRTVLAHELAHIRHHDLWLLAALRALFVVLWAHPLFWLLRRRVRLDQELLADAAAAEVSNRRDYAEQLVRLARSASTVRAPRLASSVGLWEGPSQLKRRITILLDEKFAVWRNCTRPWRIGSAATLTVLAALLSMVTLAPQRAESTNAASETTASEQPIGAMEFERLLAQSSTNQGFADAAGDLVAAHIRARQLPFVDEARLREIRNQFASLVLQHTPATISPENKRELLTTLRDRIDAHLPLPDGSKASTRDLNIAYLALPDRLKTLQWELWMALAQPPLDDAARAEREGQREWMRGKVAEVPKHDSPLMTHDKALASLEDMFADPLCAVFARPMSQQAYAQFQDKIDAWLDEARTGGVETNPRETRSIGRDGPYNPLPYADHHLLREALYAQWRGERGEAEFPTLDTFDHDPIVSYGIGGRTLTLGFASNRAFESDSLSLDSVEQQGWSIDATTGEIVDKEVGDFAYSGDDLRLLALRGTKLMLLDVPDWFEADAIDANELRRRIERQGRDQWVDLAHYFHQRQIDVTKSILESDSGPYIGVLTKSGCVAVVHVEEITKTPSQNSIAVRTRVRLNDGKARPDTSAAALEFTVRIVGIGTHGEGPTRWWSAEGKPIDPPPLAINSRDRISPPPVRQVIFAVDGAPGDADVRWQILPESSSASKDVKSADPNDQSKYYLHVFNVKSDAKTFELRVGVAAGDWSPVISGLNSSHGLAFGKSAVFSEPLTDSQGKTLVIVSHNLDEAATRLVGGDKDGNKHVGQRSGGSSAGPLNQTKWQFPDLSLTDLKTCELQARPYDWIEFKDLPAEPGAIAAEPPADGKQSKKPPIDHIFDQKIAVPVRR